MNTLIIYYSKTGFTKRYATWLSEMDFGDKLMIKVFRKMMEKKSDKTDYEIELTEALSSPFDYCSKEYLAPVIDYLYTLN